MIGGIRDRLQGKSICDIFLYVAEKISRGMQSLVYKVIIAARIPNRVCSNLPECPFDSASDVDYILADAYCNHVFDLLGSGPKKLIRKQGFEIDEIQHISGYSLKTVVEEIQKINRCYKPIAWQADFKNGYLFNELQKSDSIRVGDSNGFEIKVPWELARCQHLPYLARLFRLTNDIRYKQEILCEILDFVAFNPIGYGVNWKCTMDVAIRVSNWVMALDLIGAFKDQNDTALSEIVSKSVYQHCIFIRYHLEDQRGYRGNHYLADITGLLFASSFFESRGRIRRIQNFAIESLFRSIAEQFYDDGGNFESSLPYHRLSLELAIYGVWRVLALGEYNDLFRLHSDKLGLHAPELVKLGRASQMMLNAIKPNGEIYQLGDNDSGHLFRFYHYGELVSLEQYCKRYGHSADSNKDGLTWDENELNCFEISGIIGSIIEPYESGTLFDGLLGSVYASSNAISIIREAFFEEGFEALNAHKQVNYPEFPYQCCDIIQLSENIVLSDIRPFYYPDFGLVGFAGSRFYLGVSLTDVGQHGRGGHSHNDKLSYELFANGIELERDPGSFVYTESQEWRNRFRSSLAHNSPYFGQEQNEIGPNCFELKQQTKCELIELSSDRIVASCKYGTIYVVRRFDLFKDRIVVTDYSNTRFEERCRFGFFSNGYGRKITVMEGDNNG